jgi:phage baseplate assembly protein W
MPNVNQTPPLVNAAITRTLAFPFQIGRSGFPAMSSANNAIYQSIQSLMLTGRNERLMHVDMGVNMHRMVFDNLTPLLQARIATEVTQAIESWEPRAEVLGVDSRISERSDGVDTAIIVDVLYRVAGQPQSQQVLIPLVGSPNG